MAQVAVTHLNNPKTVRAWYMYDWANSVYTLVITTAIFPIYYKAVAVESGTDQVFVLGYQIQNSVLYSYALSLSFLIVALILPFLSGAADYSGNKKGFMKFFVWMGSIACMGLYFFDDVSMLSWGIGCSMIASIGYSGSLVFYDAFLPEIVSQDRFDKTSAKGYSMGYYGSVLMMIVCLMIIMNPGSFGFSGDDAGKNATRFTFLLVGLWWIGFSMIPFSVLPDNPYNRRPKGNIWTKGYIEISKVWNELKSQPDMKRYLIAFFFLQYGSADCNVSRDFIRHGCSASRRDKPYRNGGDHTNSGSVGCLDICQDFGHQGKQVRLDHDEYNLDRCLCGSLLCSNRNSILRTGLCGWNDHGRYPSSITCDLF